MNLYDITVTKRENRQDVAVSLSEYKGLDSRRYIVSIRIVALLSSIFLVTNSPSKPRAMMSRLINSAP